ncbi:MAG: hypothetical protein P1U37_11665 [Minwuia sp.]|nr:hypothetical protein [Minwuia sp.]
MNARFNPLLTGLTGLLAFALTVMVTASMAQQGGTYRPDVTVYTEGGAPCALNGSFLADAISRKLAQRQARPPIRTRIFVRVRSVWKFDGCHDRLDVYYSTRRSRGSNTTETFYTPHSSHHQQVAPPDARTERYEGATDAAIRLFDRTNQDLNLIPMN